MIESQNLYKKKSCSEWQPAEEIKKQSLINQDFTKGVLLTNDPKATLQNLLIEKQRINEKISELSRLQESNYKNIPSFINESNNSPFQQQQYQQNYPQRRKYSSNLNYQNNINIVSTAIASGNKCYTHRECGESITQRDGFNISPIKVPNSARISNNELTSQVSSQQTNSYSQSARKYSGSANRSTSQSLQSKKKPIVATQQLDSNQKSEKQQQQSIDKMTIQQKDFISQQYCEPFVQKYSYLSNQKQGLQAPRLCKSLGTNQLKSGSYESQIFQHAQESDNNVSSNSIKQLKVTQISEMEQLKSTIQECKKEEDINQRHLLLLRSQSEPQNNQTNLNQNCPIPQGIIYGTQKKEEQKKQALVNENVQIQQQLKQKEIEKCDEKLQIVNEKRKSAKKQAESLQDEKLGVEKEVIYENISNLRNDSNKKTKETEENNLLKTQPPPEQIKEDEQLNKNEPLTNNCILEIKITVQNNVNKKQLRSLSHSFKKEKQQPILTNIDLINNQIQKPVVQGKVMSPKNIKKQQNQEKSDKNIEITPFQIILDQRFLKNQKDQDEIIQEQFNQQRNKQQIQEQKSPQKVIQIPERIVSLSCGKKNEENESKLKNQKIQKQKEIQKNITKSLSINIAQIQKKENQCLSTNTNSSFASSAKRAVPSTTSTNESSVQQKWQNQIYNITNPENILKTKTASYYINKKVINNNKKGVGQIQQQISANKLQNLKHASSLSENRKVHFIGESSPLKSTTTHQSEEKTKTSSTTNGDIKSINDSKVTSQKNTVKSHQITQKIETQPSQRQQQQQVKSCQVKQQEISINQSANNQKICSVQSKNNQQIFNFQQQKYTIVLSLKNTILIYIYNTHKRQYEYYLRPGIQQFLEKLSKLAYIIIFSTESEAITLEALQYVDPCKKFFSKVYFQKDLTSISKLQQKDVFSEQENKQLIKNPYALERNLQYLLFIESEETYVQLSKDYNIYLIKPWTDPNKEDKELIYLQSRLTNQILLQKTLKDFNSFKPILQNAEYKEQQHYTNK